MLARRCFRVLLALSILWLPTVLIADAHAQQVSAAVPPAALSRMPPGVISLRFETRQIGTDTVGLHLFVVPKGRNPSGSPPPEPGRKKTPVTRADVLAAPDSLIPSPFFVDLFTRDGAVWTPRHRAEFMESGNPGEITVKYLRPTQREGPIFFLDYGHAHWKRWVLIVVPQGVRSGKAFAQGFLWGGEGEFNYSVLHFDANDERGLMTVSEVSRIDESTPEIKRTYHWNGERFADSSARFFLIGEATKSQSDADASRRKSGMEDAEVVRTGNYSKLTPTFSQWSWAGSER